MLLADTFSLNVVKVDNSMCALYCAASEAIKRETSHSINDDTPRTSMSTTPQLSGLCSAELALSGDTKLTYATKQ
jgi:hypothetical protein